jgi:hypothetical protein
METLSSTLGSATTLHRANADGSGDTTFAFTGVATFYQPISGQVGSRRLYQFSVGNTVNNVIPGYVSIDITNPDSPSFFNSGNNPFNNQRTLWIQPVTNLVAIAHTLTTANTNLDSGALWRTTDGGQTWTRVVSTTTHLGNSGADTFGGQTIAVDFSDTNSLWAASQAPWVLHSTDQGQTWTEETVNGSGADTALEWTTIGLARSVTGPASEPAPPGTTVPPGTTGTSRDPVNTLTGAYGYSRTDVPIAGRGPSPTLTRFYNGADTRVGPMGPGWNHSYAARLRSPGDGSQDLLLVNPDGRTDRFTRNLDGSYSSPPSVTTKLVQNGDSSFTATLADQTTWSLRFGWHAHLLTRPVWEPVEPCLQRQCAAHER